MNGVPLPEDTPDIARLLKEHAGYKTALVGKAHFEPASAPGRPYFENYAASQDLTGPHRGFDHMELCGHTGRAGRSLFHYPKWLEETYPGAASGFQEYVSPEKEISGKPGGDTGAVQVWHNDIPREIYHTDWVADRVIAWLDSLDADADWFVWMSFPDPHHPWDPPQSELRGSIGATWICPRPILAIETKLSRFLRPSHVIGSTGTWAKGNTLTKCPRASCRPT